jgi:hypothetical protein
MKSKKTAETMMEMMEDMEKELVSWIEKGNKSSAKRARKLTLEFEKLGKQFRKESVQDCSIKEI